jgi:transcriptional regulator CtsR
MNMSDIIESMLAQMLKSAEGAVEIKRNVLAGQLGCVPSQINYVIATRFTRERGYVVESRRGGGGYIKIRRAADGGGQLIRFVNAAGSRLSFDAMKDFIINLADNGQLTPREARMIAAALDDNTLALPPDERDRLRAQIFKNMLLSIAAM